MSTTHLAVPEFAPSSMRSSLPALAVLEASGSPATRSS